MIIILLVGDEGERNACFTDQKQDTTLKQHWLSVLYHKSLWLYPSSPTFRLLQLWGWWWQERSHYLNTKKHRGVEEALIPEPMSANTQTTYLKTQLSKKVQKFIIPRRYLFIYSQVLIEFPLTLNSWNSPLIDLFASALAFLQAVLNSAFRMALLKPKSFSLLLQESSVH